MIPYSHRFIGVKGLNSATAEYLVPRGKTAIVRTVTVFSRVGPSPSEVHAKQEPEGWTFWWSNFTQGDGARDQFEGRVVFNEGEAIQVSAGGGDCDITVTGYLLSN